MKFSVDKNNAIVGVIELGAGGVEYGGDVPADFGDHQTDGYYMIEDTTIVKNPDWTESPNLTADTGPGLVMQALNALGLQVAQLMAAQKGTTANA